MMKRIILFLSILIVSCSQQPVTMEPDNDGTGNGNNGSGSGNNGSNSGNNGGSTNNTPKPVPAFKVDRYDCIWPCKVTFTNQSTNTTGYYFWWVFGSEGSGNDRDQKLFLAQRFLKDPYYIYYGIGTVQPRLYITTKQEAGSTNLTPYYEFSSGIKVRSPQGLSGKFYARNGPVAAVSVSTKLNNSDTWFDLEITQSNNSRIPIGRYVRGGSYDQIMRGEPMAAYYLTTNPKKQILIYGQTHYYNLIHAGDFLWKDDIGEINFRREGLL